MARHMVEIEETLSRIVTVEADSYEEAKQQVINDYFAEKIILDADDFVVAEFINPMDEFAKVEQRYAAVKSSKMLTIKSFEYDRDFIENTGGYVYIYYIPVIASDGQKYWGCYSYENNDCFFMLDNAGKPDYDADEFNYINVETDVCIPIEKGRDADLCWMQLALLAWKKRLVFVRSKLND